MQNFLHLVLASPDSSLLYEGHYDSLLVIFSVGIAIFASYASFMVSNHITYISGTVARYLWTLVGGFCMGAGVWAMHFTGMLAFSLPCTTTYDPVVTFFSMIPGILASTLAVWIISRREISFRGLVSGGLLLGAGIGTMHYTGMAAYRMNGLILYDLKLFVLSLLVAVTLATMALWLKFYLQSWQERAQTVAPIVGAAVMGLAISAMHYTAMGAAYFVRQGDSSHPGYQLAPAFIASIVLVITSAIIVVTLIAIFLAKPAVFSFSRVSRPIGVLILGWCAVSWIGASYYNAQLSNQTYLDELGQAQQSVEDVSSDIGVALKTLQGVPDVLAQDEILQRMLRHFGPHVRPSTLKVSERKRLWTQDAAISRLNAFLADMARGFNADVVWVVNAAGDCVAASNSDKPASFIGTNYSDRQYFQQARNGQQGRQYAVGRVSKIPGLFYSAPVFEKGQFVGAVVAKRDITNFLRWIKPAGGFIVDSNGVIVLAADKSLEYQTLPGASVMNLSEQERTQQYKQSIFKPLLISAWKEEKFDGVVHLNQAIRPLVLRSKHMAEGDIDIFVSQPLPDLARLDNESPWVFLLVFVTGSMFIISLSTVVLNIRAAKKAKEAAEEAMARLKEHEQQLQYIAHYDALTNLPNRVLLADRLQQAMLQAQRRGQSLAVAYIDLDGFKAVNDQYGHDAGDELLIVVAHRMKSVLREGDSLARIGGDEFIAVLVDLERPHDCDPVLARLLQAAADPVSIGGTALQVSASAGVTFYPQDGADTDQLMRHADQAMYLAKQAGKNRYHLFDVAQDAAVQTRRESLEHIRCALERREFVLHYQPKVNMRTGKVIGAEALIRWQHPERGLLPPAAFLPVVEDQPFSVELGKWVIDTALEQMAAWHQEGLEIPVSVNIGGRQLQQEDFVKKLAESLSSHPNIPRHWLELEILETSALDDIAQISQIMRACREIGVHFALDDFGTGYSSLTYLKHLPAELIKIDQSFIRDMLDDADDLAIVNGVIGLASAFHRKVIAEGVETVAHGTLLLSLGCELAQGYGIARPMPAADIPGWVASWRPDAAWTN